MRKARILVFCGLLSLLLAAGAAGQAKKKGKARPEVDPAAPPEWVKPPIEARNTQYRTFQSEHAKGPASYLVYLPPDYLKSAERRYPVMYWLHGRGGAQTGIPLFVDRLTRAIEAGKTPPMIVVFVNGLPTGGYIDWADGSRLVESVIVKDLIPHIDKTWRTIAKREGRLIEGFSMGGNGAARLGMKYPELFCAIGAFAGAFNDAASLQQIDAGLFQHVYGDPARFNTNSAWTLSEKNAEKLRETMKIRLVVGSQDGLQERCAKFHERLGELKIPHEYEVIPGAGHNHALLYDGLGEKNWAFYRAAFK